MILCIDIGNTNVSFLLNHNLSNLRFNLATDRAKTEDEYFFNIASVLNYYKIDLVKINKIVICSVVPQLNFVFVNLCKKYFNKSAKILENTDININIDIPNKNELGMDRLVDSFGSILIAQEKGYNASLVVDFGTATTFNFSIKKNNTWSYQGGAICPGINLSLESLKSATAKLPRVSFQECDNILGKNTTDAINSGMFFGYKSLTEGIIKEFLRLHDNIYVIATGGLSSIICKNISFVHLVEKDLTLNTILKISESI